MTQVEQAHVQVRGDIRRLKQYFPYRICWGAVHAETGEIITGADLTRHRYNRYLRQPEWQVYEYVA